jgi:hypothetical protein
VSTNFVVGLLFWVFIGVPIALTVLVWIIGGIVRLFGGGK